MPGTLEKFSRRGALGRLSALAVAAGGLGQMAPAFAQNTPLRLGIIAPRGGMLGFAGECGFRALNWGVARINAQGGIGGRKVEIVTEEETTPKETIDRFRRLVLQEKVDCVQGLISSGVSLALAPAAEQSRVLTMMWDGTTQDGVKEMLPNPKFVFRSVDNEIGVVMSTLLALKAYKGRITRIAGVNPDYTYGRNAWIAFQAILKKYNVPHTVVSEQWVKAGSMDLSSNIAALQGTKPDLVFSSLLFSDLPVFMRQAHNSGLTESVRFVLPDGGWQQIGLKKEFTPEGVVLGHGSMYFASPTASALQKEFVQDYVNRYKEVPHFEADRAYFCLQMYKAGVEAALVARSGRWPGPAEIAEAIPGLPVPTFGGTASMRPDHIPDMTMYGGLTTHKSNYDFVTLATVETMSTKEIQKPPQADFWQWLEAAKFSV
jgi:branched-chain amino acid transport system substrate-binding protein